MKKERERERDKEYRKTVRKRVKREKIEADFNLPRERQRMTVRKRDNQRKNLS